VSRYLEKLHGMRRDELDSVVDVIFRAATHSDPKLRWPVGRAAFAGALRRFVPDALYEWIIGLAFGLRRGRGL